MIHFYLGTLPAKSTGEPVIFGRVTRRDQPERSFAVTSISTFISGL